MIRFCVLICTLLVLGIIACNRTEMAPAPGSDKDSVVREMLEFIKEEQKQNRKARAANHKALLEFIAKQNEENRKFLLAILEKYQGSGKISPKDIDRQLPSEEQEKSETTPSSGEQPSSQDKEQEQEVLATEGPIRISDFVEKDNRPKPVLGEWNPYSQDIDPNSFPDVNLADYPVFPNEDEGADASVPANMGGKGFAAWAKDNGWQTNTDFPLVGDSRAKKGGSLRRYIPQFPGNLRPMGANHNTTLNYYIRFSLWQTLLTEHHITKEWVPVLATHWKHSEDGKTHYMRLNPNARWNDGSPVTVDDVIATYEYYTHPDLGHPSNVQTWEKLEPPKKISKYIFSITEKERKYVNWYNLAQNFYVFPAKDLRAVEPKEFNAKYNYLPMMGSGPYTYGEENIVDDQSIEIVRKKDWWAKDQRLYQGMFNLDTIKFLVILDSSLVVEKLKKQEIDAYYVFTSRLWVKEMNFEEIQKGYIQKRLIYNHEPAGTQYIAMNMEKPPFDKWEIRRAFSHLFPFEQISSQLLYNAYFKLTSYYPAGPYENKDNPVIAYDQNKALRLLNRAGYRSRNEEGLLVNEQGEPLSATLIYSSPGLKPHLEIFQNACKEVGIALTLQLMSNSTAFQKAQQRDFEMFSGAWGQSAIPTPESSWKSTLGPGTNNITGLKNPKIDQWIEEYTKSFDPEERVELIQKIDRELVRENPYILTWYAPFKRLLWWNKYSYPPGVIMRYEDYYYWNAILWYDKEKAQKLEKSLEEGEPLLAGGVENRFWDKFQEWYRAMKQKKENE